MRDRLPAAVLPRALAVAGAALLAAVSAGCGDGGDAARPTGQPKAFCAPQFGSHIANDPAARRAAKAGTLEVSGKPLRLAVGRPVDWAQNPYDSDNWRNHFASLAWLEPLTDAFSFHRDRAALTEAIGFAADFASTHPEVVPADRTVWERKRAGTRASLYAFLLEAGRCAKLIDAPMRALLTKAVITHGRFLRASATRVENHSLLGQLALLEVAERLPQLAEARRWRRAGLRSSLRIARALIDQRTGVHLEHSPGYQDQTVAHIAKLADLAGGAARGKLERLVRRMREVTPWFVMPDRTIVPFGDTYSINPAPVYARDPGARRGLSPLRRDGYSIVKAPGSFLGVAAGYHTVAHKHSDELTFDLYGHGRRVIVDSGRRNKRQDRTNARLNAAVDFTLSSQAASTLTVDDRSFALPENSFYGSAIDAQGAGDGWYAIAGHNPLLEPDGVEHRRLFLYKPGAGVVIADTVRSPAEHSYQRWLQIAPGIDAERRGAVTELTAPGFAGTIWSPGGSARLYRGHAKPLRGWWVPPGYAPLRPRNTLALRTRGTDQDLIATVSLGPQPLRARIVSAGDARTRVRIAFAGDPPRTLTLIRHGETIELR